MDGKETAQKLLCKLQSDGLAKDKTLADVLWYVMTAKQDICLFLRRDDIGQELESKVLALALLRIKKDELPSGIKSSSYAEGSVSQSTTYQTPGELEEAEKAVFSSLYPQRRCRIV